MSDTTGAIHGHVLDGCQPTPLARYLKALGILRLVTEQADPRARGHWYRDRFVLRTTLDRDALEAFFLETYRPTPIVAPWNGGSGFHPKDNKKAIQPLSAAASPRFDVYRDTLDAARGVLSRLKISEKVGGDEKRELLEACRGALPDQALDWLDAAYLLTEDGAKYPPLLGTGGNDGRLDFTNNFMQRLLDLVDPQSGQPTANAPSLLAAALFDEPCEALESNAIGQFMPGNAGGANGTSGFDAGALINPWDFVLMLEGAVVFASAAVRKMEHEASGALSYPFTVRQVGVGYSSASEDDESSARAEMWMPLWARPASYEEVSALFSEGRARIGGRSARNGLDFARAVAGLGVDRGIEAFQRYGFQVRNGLAYLAVPLNRFPVRAEPRVHLLHEIDAWLDRFRSRAGTDKAPASAHRALRQLETAILELCQRGDTLRVQQVLTALGRCERVMATSQRWTEEAYLQPVPPLSPQWLKASDDGSMELRLAASLASIWGHYKDSQGRRSVMPLRRQLEPVTTWKHEDRLHARWDFEADRDVAWSPAHLEQALNAVLQRRLVRAVQQGEESYADRGWHAAPGDIADFIEGRVDDTRLADLLWGCALLDWTRVRAEHRPAPRRPARQPWPGAFYALIKLCFAGAPSKASEEAPMVAAENHDVPEDTAEAVEPRNGSATRIPLNPRIHRLAASGQGAAASEQAIRRLRGSGLGPALGAFQVRGDIARRSAAALLFPLSPRDLQRLADMVLRPDQLADENSQPTSQTTQGATP